MRLVSRTFWGFTAVICFATSSVVWAWIEPPASQAPTTEVQPATNEASLTEAQMMQFLRKAKVIRSKQTSKGVTAPYRLTLTDGVLTHDALFQSIDESKTSMQLANGTTEMNFRDSYHFNIAAYELAKLVGLGDMMPVTVERNWGGKTGSLEWWLTVKMDEADRMKKKISPPDPDAWNKQMYKMRVFAQLVYDTDRNLTNVLIGEDWQLYMIDFTRAFRLYDKLENADNLVQCDRLLLEKLRHLNASELEQNTKDHVGKREIKAVMARRDKIVAYFEQLIARQGESKVLY
jgi:ribosomal protein S15P/S13E